jgi:hypothetical protein
MPSCAKLAVLGLLAASASGCMVQRYQDAHDVPLDIHPPGLSPVVVVSMKYSTGWISWVLAMRGDYPLSVGQRELHLERIRRVDSAAPVLFIPRVESAMSVLLLYRGEDDAYALFAPGYQPGVYDSRTTGEVKFEVPERDKRPVRACWRPMPNSKATANVGPSVGPRPWVSLQRVVSNKAFWDTLRWRHFWGQDGPEITIVCRAVRQAAEAFECGGPEWAEDQQAVLDWCRQIDEQAAAP